MLVVALAIAIPNAFGAKTVVVQSGSMEPSIHTGSLVFATPVAKEDIHIGDVISFNTNERKTVMAHRVVAVDEQGRFRVKGDMNATVDAYPVPYENVVGIVRFSVPLAGYAMGFVKTQHGLIVVTYAMIILFFLQLLLGEKPSDRRKALPVAAQVQGTATWKNELFTRKILPIQKASRGSVSVYKAKKAMASNNPWYSGYRHYVPVYEYDEEEQVSEM